MKPYTHETLPRDRCKRYDIPISYTLRISKATKTTDRFNTKEQNQWVIDRDGQTRRGMLLLVGQAVPKKDARYYRNQKRRKKRWERNGIEYTNAEWKSFEEALMCDSTLCLKQLNKVRLILKIKDDTDGQEFYINMMNVIVEDDVMTMLIHDFKIPEIWLKTRERNMKKIKQVPINFSKNEEYWERKHEKETQERKEKDEYKIEVWKREIGHSRYKYTTYLNRAKDKLKVRKKAFMDASFELEMLQEYWNSVPDEEKTEF